MQKSIPHIYIMMKSRENNYELKVYLKILCNDCGDFYRTQLLFVNNNNNTGYLS